MYKKSVQSRVVSFAYVGRRPEEFMAVGDPKINLIKLK